MTLAVARNADPSTPAAVEDAQTLVVELETLNGSLATTNQLMSDAITNAEYMSANVQAKLAGLSAQFGDAEAGVGQARSLLGSQLSDTTGSELRKAQEQLQSGQRALAQGSGRLEELQLDAVDARIQALESREELKLEAVDARIRALESRQAATDDLTSRASDLRTEVEQLRSIVQAERERARALAAQLQQLKRAHALLQKLVAGVARPPSR